MACCLLAACSDDPPEPPPPSTPPAITAPVITCGAAPAEAGPYAVSYPIVESEQVTITDDERDLLSDQVRGTINGLPMASLKDEDTNLTYVWTPPDGVGPIVCRNEMVLQVEARDLDGNATVFRESIAK